MKRVQAAQMKQHKPDYQHVVHPWPPLYDEHSKVLLLGSLPSPKSLSFGFYYGSPQNIFWQTLAKVLDQKEADKTIESRRNFALRNHIAIWQTLAEADIIGSQDATIKNPVANDFSNLLASSQIQTIFTEGKKSTELFNRLVAPAIGQEAIYLPSTSPANRATQAKPIFMARWSLVKQALEGQTLK